MEQSLLFHLTQMGLHSGNFVTKNNLLTTAIAGRDALLQKL